MAGDSQYILLLDLDALFDTRMGTLLTLDAELSNHLDVRAYLYRTRDDFTSITQGRVTTEAFLERYQRRDMTVLRHSIITGILPVMMAYIDSLEERFIRGVDISAIQVDLNLWPYKLPGPVIETFKNCLRALLPPHVQVEAVYVAPEEMTPETFSKHYNGWVTYHFHPWLELHQEALLVRPINQLAVILPKLFYQEPGEIKTSSELLKDADEHGLFELVMEDYIHLEHLPVVDFSFVTPGSYKVDAQSSSSSSLASAASTEDTKSS